ncbi:MAG: outer membrane beta-barrel protein [Bacteroidia bacterium]|nr:outer membrane beta-barrel protein [Bacteroidia bacterium]
MKTFICIFAFSILFYNGYAQYSTEIPEYARRKDTLKSGNTLEPNSSFNILKNNPKIRTSLELGTSVSSFKGYGTCFNTFVSPFVSYDLSNRFSLDVGVTYSRGNMLNTYNPLYGDISLPVAGSLDQKLVFTRGRYLVNDRITLYGTAAYGINTYKQNGDNKSIDYQAKEFSFGAEFKVTDNSMIGIEIRNVSGNAPFQQFDNVAMFPQRSYFNH